MPGYGDDHAPQHRWAIDTVATGIHVYFQLNLTLRLAAAEDDQSAERYLELMAEFTAIIYTVPRASFEPKVVSSPRLMATG